MYGYLDPVIKLDDLTSVNIFPSQPFVFASINLNSLRSMLQSPSSTIPNYHCQEQTVEELQHVTKLKVQLSDPTMQNRKQNLTTITERRKQKNIFVGISKETK